MTQVTWVQSQVESYKKKKKKNLMPPCLMPSIIMYRSSVNWSYPGKRIVPFPTPWCSIHLRLRYKKKKKKVKLATYFIWFQEFLSNTTTTDT